MQHDARKMRLVRESMGMTQEKLAILASVSPRTVQRAEAGHRMSLETLNDFAAALEIPLGTLVVDPDEINDGEPVGLRRVVSARGFLEDLTTATVASFACEIDPEEEELNLVLKLVGMIEARLPTPWDFDTHPGAGSIRDRLLASSELKKLQTALEGRGIGLFAATSWIRAKIPIYDMDEGHRYTHDRHPFHSVMALQIALCRSMDDRAYRKPITSWGIEVEAPAPATSPGWGEEDGDVPF